MPMHFFGGAFIALMLLWLYFYSNIVVPKPRTIQKIAVYAVLTVFLLGVAWELYEFSLDTFLSSRPQYLLDSISDLFFDTAGASIAIWYAIVRKYIS